MKEFKKRSNLGWINVRKRFNSYRDKEVTTKCTPNFCPGSKDYLLLIKPIQQNLLISEHKQCKRKGLEKLVLTDQGKLWTGSIVETEATCWVKHARSSIYFLKLFSKIETFPDIFACQARLECKLFSGHSDVPWQLIHAALVKD